MADRYFNPFANVDVLVPSEFRDDYQRYCQTGGRAVVDQSPFPRMVDMWFLSLSVAVARGLRPLDVTSRDTYKIIDGGIFSSDPWRVHAIMLVAIANSEADVKVVAEPRRMMAIANGLAAAGMPEIVRMLRDGDGEPIWNISEEVEALLRVRSAA